MSKITRYTQKLFGTSASTNQMAEYGSLAASSPQLYSGTTITPAIVQNLANFSQGWFSAVLGSNSCTIEDMNSLCYLFAYQLSYLLQEGIAEWDSGTTYYTGSIVNDGTGILYSSVGNANLNNPLPLGSSWMPPILPGTVIPKVAPFTGTLTIPTGNVITWPTMGIANGTIILSTNCRISCEWSMTISSVGVLQVLGTSVVRIF